MDPGVKGAPPAASADDDVHAVALRERFLIEQWRALWDVAQRYGESMRKTIRTMLLLVALLLPLRLAEFGFGEPLADGAWAFFLLSGAAIVAAGCVAVTLLARLHVLSLFEMAIFEHELGLAKHGSGTRYYGLREGRRPAHHDSRLGRMAARFHGMTWGPPELQGHVAGIAFASVLIAALTGLGLARLWVGHPVDTWVPWVMGFAAGGTHLSLQLVLSQHITRHLSDEWKDWLRRFGVLA